MSFIWYQNIVFAAFFFFRLLSFQVEGKNKNNVRGINLKHTAAAVIQGHSALKYLQLASCDTLHAHTQKRTNKTGK